MLYRNSTLSSEGTVPLLTIITVVRNARFDFDKTVASVASQKQCGIEYVVVDGASNDGTVESAIRSSAIIDIFLTEPDRGIYDAMNKGLSLSKGRSLLFLNAGDTLVSGAVPNLLKSLHRDSHLVCHAVQLCRAGKTIGMYYAETPPVSPDPQHMYWPHPGILAQRTVFDLIGNFDITLRYSADLDWMNRVIRSGSFRISYCIQPVVYFSLGGASSKAQSASESRRVAIRHGKFIIFAWWRYVKIRVRQIGRQLLSLFRISTTGKL